jgi:hypothetical protein
MTFPTKQRLIEAISKDDEFCNHLSDEFDPWRGWAKHVAEAALNAMLRKLPSAHPDYDVNSDYYRELLIMREDEK